MIHNSRAYVVLFGLALLPSSLIASYSLLSSAFEYQTQESNLITPIVSELPPAMQELIIRGPLNTFGISAKYVGGKRVSQEAILRELHEHVTSADQGAILRELDRDVSEEDKETALRQLNEDVAVVRVREQEKLAARKQHWPALCFSSLFWTFVCSSGQN